MKKNKFWTAVSRVLAGVTVALVVILVLAPGASAAGTYKVLHQFSGSDGGYPQDDHLTFDAAGNLYGTTDGGGAYENGTVFELTPNSDGTWTETVLYSFTGGSDGAIPLGGLIFDVGGNLYGTANSGGSYGSGTVFQLSPGSSGWTFNLLYSFDSGIQGYGPNGGLVFDPPGNLYGTTFTGGAYGFGMVFKLAPNGDGTWTESVLHSFKTRSGGGPDHNTLVFDSAGDLYGTTDGEYYSQCCGVVYELIPQPDGSWQFKVLHHMKQGNGGYSPEGILVFDKGGNLYGTTSWGGGGNGCGWGGCGTVFKLSPGSNGKWTEHVLYRFKGGKDAEQPYAGVIFDQAGNLYGTTLHGGGGNCGTFWGGSGCGTVYELTPNGHGGWREHVVHRFRGPAGGNPWGGIILDGNGNIYGTASGQGTSGSNGSVFEITP